MGEFHAGKKSTQQGVGSSAFQRYEVDQMSHKKSGLTHSLSSHVLDNDLEEEEGRTVTQVSSLGSGAGGGTVSGAGLRTRVRSDSNILQSSTVRLKDFYKNCNRDFRYAKGLNPRRALTKDCKGCRNNGFDNAALDLIMLVGDSLLGKNVGYRVLDLLGQGSFGQVVKCLVEGGEQDNSLVAVKVIKNKPAYYNQALVETRILRLLNQEEEEDGSEGDRIVKLLDCFEYHNHLCLVFELLSINLYELIKQKKFRGLPMDFVRSCLQQITDALQVLAEAGVIHCDLKPENILIEYPGSNRVKLVDFGSSCFKGQTVYTYIQSRFYRAPEILLGLPYGSAIDLWSLGCLAVELFIGLPVFPGCSEHNQLCRITETIEPFSNKLLSLGKDTPKFFTILPDGNFQLKTAEEWAESQNLDKPEVMKRYVKEIRLESIIMNGSNRHVSSNDGYQDNAETRTSLLDFVKGLLRLDPEERWTAWQAKSHPFLLSETLSEPYQPEPDPWGSPSTSSSQSAVPQPTKPAPIPGNANVSAIDTQQYSHLVGSPGQHFSYPDTSNVPWATAGSFEGGKTGAGPMYAAGASPLSPPSRPDHPYPLAYQASWTRGNYMDVRFKPDMYYAAAPKMYSPWEMPPSHQYASCPPNLGQGFYNHPYFVMLGPPGVYPNGMQQHPPPPMNGGNPYNHSMPPAPPLNHHHSQSTASTPSTSHHQQSVGSDQSFQLGPDDEAILFKYSPDHE